MLTAIMLTAIMLTAYGPHIVIHNTNTSTVELLKLTCPLDSDPHLESA